MDLYFQAAAVSLAGAAFAYLIYVMMTPAQMFAPVIEATNAKIQARLDMAVNLDISLFNNSISIPGTAILPLLQDADSNNLAVFVQTRAGKGLVTNYGPQLRSAADTTIELGTHGKTGITANASDFEKQFVIPIRALFSPGAITASVPMGDQSYFENTAAETYTKVTVDATAPIGMTLSTGLQSAHDPVLTFWDPFLPTYVEAEKRGRTYSATGYLFTPSILRTNMPSNLNRSYALTQGNVYYVNPGSQFYTTYILDATQTVVGLYVEEHGCDAKAAILAEAMKANGYLTETFN